MLGKRYELSCVSCASTSFRHVFEPKLGATGWNWDALLPYFKKVEAVESPPSGDGIFPGATPLSEATFDQFSGRSGVVQVSPKHLFCRRRILTDNAQPSYEHFYSNITAPYVETVNGLGIFTNSEPVRSTILFHCTRV